MIITLRLVLHFLSLFEDEFSNNRVVNDLLMKIMTCAVNTCWLAVDSRQGNFWKGPK